MSRSLHTQQIDARAARRIADPYRTRAEDAGLLCGRGAVMRFCPPPSKGVRVSASKAVPGALQPLTAADVRLSLTALGPAPVYRLRAVRIRSETCLRADGMTFGEYSAPGDIHLFSVPQSPWRLPFLLLAEDIALFTRYGARIREDHAAGRTVVAWERSGLRAFYLFEVLTHELGHHMLQSARGGKRATVCRCADNERRAEIYVRRVLRARRSAVHPA